ncbi:MAG: UDP-N-acetylmuramoyl-L-alanyl-D-glutamate--2,6-diaminopimelate ligase [Gammaproteobacteria bacterium]|nr:UDP-N-acetylmuramoyl-L-alanyl-D-glutamate--2,6-diaminopimelate ligase [Gammaproteobacteria bacterium]
MMAIKISQTARSLSKLLNGIVEVTPVNNRNVTGISSDSRRVKPGDLFIAYQGLNVNGSDFVDDAIAAGAVAVIWESVSNVVPLQFAKYLKPDSGVSVFALKNLKELVGVIASRFYGEPSRKMFIFGVTGTNGKTSYCHFISQVLNNESPCGLIGTLGYGIYGDLKETNMTTPDPVSLQLYLKEIRDAGAENVAMEVSSHALDQNRIAGSDIDVAVFTNLSRDHLDYHSDMDAYGQAKQKIFELPSVKSAIINTDDEFGRQLLANMSGRKKCISYGMQIIETRPDVYASEINLSMQGVSFKVETPWGNGLLKSKLLGRFNVNNLLAVLSSLLVKGLPFDVTLDRLQRINTVPGRMERFTSEQTACPLVVIDYAHTPDALRQVLITLRDHVKGKLVCVFGCGGDRDKGKRPLMGKISTEFADEVFITDDNPRYEAPEKIINDILSGVLNATMESKKVKVIHDRAKAIHKAVTTAEPDDIVLVAGKGHEVYQQIGKEKISFSDREQVSKLLNIND